MLSHLNKNSTPTLPPCNDPITHLLFGSGRFMRGFIVAMLQELKEKNLHHGRAFMLTATPHGQTENYTRQDNLFSIWNYHEAENTWNYTISNRIAGIANPYTEWSEVTSIAQLPSLSVIVSNTTENGLKFTPVTWPWIKPPFSFPAQLTALLFHRYLASKLDPTLQGFHILPCELLNGNGDLLQSLVIRYALEWQLDSGFIGWLEEKNQFLNNIVDRIVPSLSTRRTHQLEKILGWKDALLTYTEKYSSLIIDEPKKELPPPPFLLLQDCVATAANLEAYASRKIFILNALHTNMAQFGLFLGKEFVHDCMQDPFLQSHILDLGWKHILPCLAPDIPDAPAFLTATFDRFSDGKLEHRLELILMYHSEKVLRRIIPTLQRCSGENKGLLFSLVFFIFFYRLQKSGQNSFAILMANRQIDIQDDPQRMHALWLWRSANHSSCSLQSATELLADPLLWEEHSRWLPAHASFFTKIFNILAASESESTDHYELFAYALQALQREV